MNKSILVIDMPESCAKCPLFGDHYADMCCKGLNNRGINYPYPKDFRQDWCPLREIPEIKLSNVPYEADYPSYARGFYDCLYNIM